MALGLGDVYKRLKLDHGRALLEEIDLFRKHGLDKFKTLLLKISQDPGMMYWLDNQNSHKGAPNENYGRELLELFSMGIDENGEGAYSENDVKSAAKAFTGWASKPTPPPFFLGPFPMEFNFDENDHDNSEKEFLGEKGNFNGKDIVELVSNIEGSIQLAPCDAYLADAELFSRIDGIPLDDSGDRQPLLAGFEANVSMRISEKISNVFEELPSCEGGIKARNINTKEQFKEIEYLLQPSGR